MGSLSWGVVVAVVVVFAAAGPHPFINIVGRVFHLDVFTDGPDAVVGEHDNAECPVGRARWPRDRHDVRVDPERAVKVHDGLAGVEPEQDVVEAAAYHAVHALADAALEVDGVAGEALAFVLRVMAAHAAPSYATAARAPSLGGDVVGVADAEGAGGQARRRSLLLAAVACRLR